MFTYMQYQNNNLLSYVVLWELWYQIGLSISTGPHELFFLCLFFVCFYSTVFYTKQKQVKFWIFTSLNVVYSECFVRGPECLNCLDSIHFWKKKETVTLWTQLKRCKKLYFMLRNVTFLWHQCFYDEFKMSISILW